MEHNYVEGLVISNKMNEKAIRKAIKDLELFDGANVLDVPCGIGNHISYMLDENANINVTGIDFSKNHLAYAHELNQKQHPNVNCTFEEGDINNLELPDNSFDFIWCCDGLYPGDKEIGMLVEEPYDVLKDFARIAKPGAKIAVGFFTSKRLLAGYPLLEAALDDDETAHKPFTKETDPELDILCTPAWFKKTGLTNIEVRTYAVDLYNLDKEMIEWLPAFCNIFWAQSQAKVGEEVWQQYIDIIDPSSANFIFDKDSYTGLFTYTIYIATVEK